jgi:hypothetical protein
LKQPASICFFPQHSRKYLHFNYNSFLKLVKNKSIVCRFNKLTAQSSSAYTDGNFAEVYHLVGVMGKTQSGATKVIVNKQGGEIIE